MKKSARILYVNGSFFKLLLLTALLATSSCVPYIKTRTLSPDEMENVDVIGTVNTKFNSFQWFHIYTKKGMEKKVYERLEEEVKSRFQPNHKIDVVNVEFRGRLSGWEIAMIWPGTYFVWLGNFQKIHASGDIVTAKDVQVVYLQPDNLQPNSSKTKTVSTTETVIYVSPDITNALQTKHTPKPQGLEEATKLIIPNILNELPNGSKIAVVSIASDDRNAASFVIDEVEFNLVSAKRFTIIDRSTLDLIIKEQQFQMSGDVDDKDVVKIGSLSGANVVIAGSVIKSDSSNRLSLKALDVKTGQIITMARESY